MNGAFCWKERSAEILRSSFNVLRKKHSLDDDDYKLTDDSENETQSEDEPEEDDFDDIKDIDNTVFEISSRLRQQALDEQPDLDLRLRRWRELTKIDVNPQIPPKRSKCYNNSAKQVLAKTGALQNFDQGTSNLHKLLSERGYRDTTTQGQESTITFKFQYLIITERLKVTIVQASNLFKNTELGNGSAVSIEVSLMPGKIQRQVTPLCKGTKSPIFNSLLYFNGLSLDEMHQLCLRIKVNGRPDGKGSLRTLGEVTVSLDDFDIVAETSLEEFVDTRIGSRTGCTGTFRTRMLRRN